MCWVPFAWCTPSSAAAIPRRFLLSGLAATHVDTSGCKCATRALPVRSKRCNTNPPWIAHACTDVLSEG
eukprot:5234469-Alexandrium_andersonii.AAC.1